MLLMLIQLEKKEQKKNKIFITNEKYNKTSGLELSQNPTKMLK